MKILAIADTHGRLREDDYLKIENLWSECDVCVLLGDIEYAELTELCKIIPKEKMLGVLGNHDYEGLYKEHGVIDLHKKVVVVDGYKIVGWGGTFRYKDGLPLSFTQSESESVCEEMPRGDILISHDGCFNMSINNNCHRGLKGMSRYVKRSHPRFHIRGHLHERYQKVHGMIPKTTEICVYQYKVIEV